MNALGFREMVMHLAKGEWSNDQAVRYKLSWMVYEHRQILKKYGIINDDDSE